MLSDYDLLRLEDALGHFETGLSLVDFPADWLLTNNDHVHDICKDLPVDVLLDFSVDGVIYPVSFYAALITLRSHF